jgi:membrane associated rhomboid family serine protease
MWVLIIFGDNVEDRVGSLGFLAFYLICGVVSGLTQAFIALGP